MANTKVEANNSQGVSHPSCGMVRQEKQAKLFDFNKYTGKIVLLWQPHPTSIIPAPIRLLKPFWGRGGGGFSRDCKCCISFHERI